MRSRYRWRIIWTSRSLVTIFRLQRPTFFAPRRADYSAELIPAWCRIRRGAAWAGLVRLRVVQARAERRAERVALVRARRGWCRRRWAQEQMFRLSTPRSLDS